MRNRKSRTSPIKYALVVDGQCEQRYLRALKEEEKLGIQIKPELPSKNTIEGQYQKALELKNVGYDRIFWIIDLDVVLKEARESKINSLDSLTKLKAYFKKLEIKRNIQIIINNPCLERWFFLHFTDSGRNYIDYNSLEKDLKKYLPNYEKTEKYYLNGKNIYKRLNELLPIAIKNAQKLGRFDINNPEKNVSEMPIVFEALGIKEKYID